MNPFLYSIVLIVHILGFVVFLKGFFPSKVVLSGYSEFRDAPQSPFTGSNGEPQQFNKFVLMVVDAMRADFLYSETHSHMSFVHQLISEGSAIPYTAFSNPPTVTLPRLKGITTGGTPSFLDAILNVADDKDSSQGLSSQDSWVRQFRYKSEGKTLNFYGDDTWLKLFPKKEFFSETDGTNSFFVSDFTEVDNNVTRHLDSELSQSPSTWDGLILHYLGLDHIGHKGGPTSSHMESKQKEMDSIVERIYNYVSVDKEKSEDTLFIVMGDHGMNEIGNHGGSTEGETSAGLLFISPKFQKIKSSKKLKAPLPNSENYSYFNKINQIDLVPTLAALLNFPIPKNNLGVMIKELLSLWDKVDERNGLLMENCYQFKSLVDAKYGIDLDQEIEDSADNELQNIKLKWDTLKNDTIGKNISTYYDFLYEAQGVLAASATNYNYSDITTGFILLGTSCLIVVALFIKYFVGSISIYYLIGFLSFSLAYASHFFGSSFIEEEHQIWWFFMIMSTLLLMAYSKFRSTPYFLVVLVCVRIIRTFSNTGQKFKTPYTLASYLISEPSTLWVLVILTYFILGLSAFGQGCFINCFAYPNYTTLRDRHVNDFGPIFTFIGVFVTASLSLSFKLVQSFIDGNKIPKWITWLLEWNCESFGVSDIDSIDKKQLQAIVIQLSKLFSYSLLSLFCVKLIVGKLRGITNAMYTDLNNLIVIFLVHQTRIELIPIFIVFSVIRFAMAKIILHLEKNILDELILIISVFSLCLQNVTFFSMGNTNSLATVDLSNAYNGVESYDVFIVGILTFISNFAGPIYWSLATMGWLLETKILSFEYNSNSVDFVHVKKISKQIYSVKALIYLTFYAVASVFLVGSCINLRFHLFIWTVFSPKLLFFASWTLLLNCIVDTIVIGTILLVT
ncbi:GPI ethanolamine phosphate transferase 2 [[Candida] railenensis]|uniref:GPI ethanolamine phosphate transferase 2 n=1 Tax=[Candida] railenensis TaxID=45579 RepID=A0A9P0VV96_9ASCO|nr:GPI ethanolamine phosphate transferase 2 [[Candida] railenensis]